MGPQDGVEDRVQILRQVLGEKPEHRVPVLLQQPVFALIAAVRLGVTLMTRPVDFDGEPCISRKEIDFHSVAAVEGNGGGVVALP